MKRIVLASHNQGKLQEIKSMLAVGLQLDIVSLTDCGIEQAPEETGLSFVENAIIKARYACETTGLPAIADDSGLEVDALGGEPGIYSARYAGSEADDAANNALLLQKLKGTQPPHSARFQCLLAFMRQPKDSTPAICQGTWHGHISTEAMGSNGFGYDPLFLVPDLGMTSAELEPSHKNRISHRALALQGLRPVLAAWCST